MADTHINAFFADVQEAEQKVIVAKGELEAVKARLEAKKVEVGSSSKPTSTTKDEDSKKEESK